MSADPSPPPRRKSSRRGGGGPTVADVARASGVSPMTVSRVINGEASVAEATRERVQAAVATLGYIPNTAARSLAGHGQCRIALLYDNPSAAFMSELLLGSLAHARNGDIQLMLEPYDAQEPLPRLIARLEGHQINGLLLPAPLCDDLAFVAALARQPIAMARVAATLPGDHGHALSIDNEAAAHAMTAHLIAQGHRRIGFITGAPQHHASALREAGYRRALAEAAMPVDPALIAPGAFTYRSGLIAADALLARADRPTAIFASNDDMAAGAIAAAHRHHLDVPGDLSVCGFDDTAIAASIWPELTTIRQPAAAMAGQAIDLLAAHIRAERRGQVTRLQTLQIGFELVRRASDQPPRA